MARKSTQVAIGGVAAALCLLLMFCTGLVPFATYALPALAGVVLIAVVAEMGWRTAMVVYAAVALLSLGIVPDREAAMLFLFFFGFSVLLFAFSHTKFIRETMVVGQNENQRIEDVTFENCTFFLPGGWTETPGCPRTIDKRYPEYDRHGPSAGSKFTVRYAKNFKVVNCDIQLAKEDARPEIAYFDYEE